MAKKKPAARSQVRRPGLRAKRAIEMREKRFIEWDEAMKLGVVGLVAAFVFRIFYDTYVEGIVPNSNIALYHAIVFGVVITFVWKYWPWRGE
ncbi:MAG: hypothetical protein ABH863_01695 [Candidatus Micrarchaeota archaeon]